MECGWLCLTVCHVSPVYWKNQSSNSLDGRGLYRVVADMRSEFWGAKMTERTSRPNTSWFNGDQAGAKEKGREVCERPPALYIEGPCDG